MRVVGAALIADVSNSTPLFERKGEEAALRAISQCLEEMRDQISDAGGVYLHSRGDDVLAFFEDADAALQMAKQATIRTSEGALKVHAGISWGGMLLQPDDLHGTPVNIAARLASLAKSYEVLVYETLHEELSEAMRETLRKVDTLSLKGSSDRLTVYSHLADDASGETVNFAARRTTSDGSLRVTLQHGTCFEELIEGRELSLGRAVDADIVVSQPWVSRQHATVYVMNGIVVFRDHSTLGSFVRMDQGSEIVARRNSITLIGNGLISLGAPFSQSEKSIVKYMQIGNPDK